MMNYTKEREYLFTFAKESDLSVAICRQQLRALWTAYCLHWNLEPDTAHYDSDIFDLFKVANTHKMSVKQYNLYMERFDLYMSELLC